MAGFSFHYLDAIAIQLFLSVTVREKSWKLMFSLKWDPWIFLLQLETRVSETTSSGKAGIVTGPKEGHHLFNVFILVLPCQSHLMRFINTEHGEWAKGCD